MIHYGDLYRALEEHGMEGWAATLAGQLEKQFQERLHGDLPRWLGVIEQLPKIAGSRAQLDQDQVEATTTPTIGSQQQQKITQLLKQLHPWRKGPFRIHGIDIDTEWRSDWKWQRLAPHIAPLKGRRVLDIGCGNGYHCWRMAGAGAGLVIGIDPTQLFLAQFLAIRHFLGEQWPVYLLPFGIEQLPADLQAFDTLFSMGVLYHRRSPIDHLYELKGCLRPGGELVLETLVIEGGKGETLLPPGRYAKMRNVWFIPSVPTLIGWLERCGFHNVRAVDVTATTIDEQRRTDWMQFESLADYLDPGDASRTIEGLPAPRRAILLANA